MALLAAGVEPGDRVLVPTLSFAATANAVIHCGATPVFVDSEPETGCIDPKQVEAFLREACRTANGETVETESGRRVAALVPVHLYGHPADVDKLTPLADEFRFTLVADGAEALGARYKDRPIGALGHTCALSFNGNKIITGGNGGMVLTEDGAVAERIRYLSAQAKDDPVEFVHNAVGFNFRLSNVNAALALAQAERLSEFVMRKRAIENRYETALDPIDGVALWREAAWAASSHWMAVMTVDAARHPKAIADLKRLLPKKGIEARPVWQPLHRQRAFAHHPHLAIEVAERLYATSLCLPCSTSLSDADQDRVVVALLDYFDCRA